MSLHDRLERVGVGIFGSSTTTFATLVVVDLTASDLVVVTVVAGVAVAVAAVANVVVTVVVVLYNKRQAENALK